MKRSAKDNSNLKITNNQKYQNYPKGATKVNLNILWKQNLFPFTAADKSGENKKSAAKTMQKKYIHMYSTLIECSLLYPKISINI